MDRKVILLILCMILVVVPLINAQPPFQEATGDRTLEIRFPQSNVLELGQDISYHFHVYNRSDGLLVTNSSADCFIHLYNATGSHIFQGTMGFDSNGIDWELFIDGGNFSQIGFISFIVWCNTTNQGGFVSGSLDVTHSGRLLTDADSKIYILLIILAIIALVCLIVLAFKLEWKHIRSGEGFIIKVNWQKIGKVASIYGSYLVLMWVLGLLASLARNFTPIIAFERFFEYFYLIMLYLALPLFIVTAIISGIIWFQNLKLGDKLKRGFEIE